MTFTDEDLKQLKGNIECIALTNMTVLPINSQTLLALIARLEAAEDAVLQAYKKGRWDGSEKSNDNNQHFQKIVCDAKSRGRKEGLLEAAEIAEEIKHYYFETSYVDHRNQDRGFIAGKVAKKIRAKAEKYQ